MELEDSFSGYDKKYDWNLHLEITLHSMIQHRPEPIRLKFEIMKFTGIHWEARIQSEK